MRIITMEYCPCRSRRRLRPAAFSRSEATAWINKRADEEAGRPRYRRDDKRFVPGAHGS
jgi:hypothetical protein